MQSNDDVFPRNPANGSEGPGHGFSNTTAPIEKPTVPQQMPRGPLIQTDNSLLIPALGLFIATLTGYFLTRTRYNTFDAVSYANQVEHLFPRTHDAHWLFHPHHLLFNATAYLIWRPLAAAGYRGGALRTIQDLNTVWAAAGITLYYLILRLFLKRSRWLPLLISIGLSLSFGYWISATDARVNMPSTTLLIAAFYVLCLHIESPTMPRASLVGFLAGLSALYHESAVIFFVVGLAGLILPDFSGTIAQPDIRRNRLHYAAAYVVTWILTVTVPYLFVGIVILHIHSIGGFKHWLTSYSELGWWWSFTVLHNLRLDAYALRRTAFVEPAGKQGTFHLDKSAPVGISTLYFMALAGWFSAVYAFGVALPLLWRMQYARILVICLIWIALYSAFFTFWSPGYFIFWVPVLVPIGLLIALCLAHYRAKRGGIAVNWLVGAWILIIALVNLQSSIAPHLKETSDPFQRIAGNIAAHTRSGDIVVVTGAGDAAQCEVDIPYFADRECVSLHTILTRQHNDPVAAIEVARSQMDSALAAGHNVYALDEVWNSPLAMASLEQHHPGWVMADEKILFQPYRRIHAWMGSDGWVWQLLPTTAALPTDTNVAVKEIH